MLFEA